MVQSDFFDIIDEEEDFEPRRGILTAMLVLSTVFLVAGMALAFLGS